MPGWRGYPGASRVVAQPWLCAAPEQEQGGRPGWVWQRPLVGRLGWAVGGTLGWAVGGRLD
jgi:hypothetical protein